MWCMGQDTMGKGRYQEPQLFDHLSISRLPPLLHAVQAVEEAAKQLGLDQSKIVAPEVVKVRVRCFTC